MKRALLLGAVAAMLVAAPIAAAAGKTTTYSGDIDGGGTIEFTVKTTKKHHKKKSKVIDFRFEGLPLDCAGGDGTETTSGALNFKVPVKKGKFTVDAVLGSSQNPKAALLANGKIKKGSARGDIRVHGTEVPLDGGGTGDCDSDTVDWSATK
jgi:hypothetical protein